MISGPSGAGKNSLMSNYSLRLGEAVLRSRTRDAEQHARLETEIARRVKSEFISNMSHELRTPLNTVIGFSKMLAEQDRRKLTQTEVAEYAKLIQDAAAHLLSLINDILDISKLQSGRYSIDAQEVDIDDIVEATARTYAKQAAEAGINFTHRIASDLPPTLGDRQKLGQAIANLLSNAIKFTPTGGGVSIEVRAKGLDGSEIFIRDTGVGMDPEDLKVAMAPFGQVDGTRARWREGAGLGLPIAKALVELHGGTLAMQSTKGIGTEVTIFLPSRQWLDGHENQTLAIDLSGGKRRVF